MTGNQKGVLMAQLATTYMGLELANPVIAASCGLTGSIDGVKKFAEFGAGAVVLKSIFEEQIDVEVDDMAQQSWLPGHPEAFDYVRQMGYALGPGKYLDLISQAKNSVDIPVIASLNCVTPRWWNEYARKIEQAGADGLELNISIRPSDPERTSRDIEKIYFSIIESIKPRIKIPIAVKVGPYFTSLGYVVHELVKRGADAVVLFNRFFKLDIDTENLKLTAGYPFSTPAEMGRTLRWIALLAGRIDADLTASTGIHDAQGIIKQLLAGATVTEICSVLYQKGIEYISTLLKELENWMDERGFQSVDDCRGKLSQEDSDNPELYESLQYIKALVGME